MSLGYEDLTDNDHVASGKMLAIAVGKSYPNGLNCTSIAGRGKALAGKSTLNRLQLTPVDTDSNSPYKKIVLDTKSVDNLFVDIFLKSHADISEEIIPDVDSTGTIKLLLLSFVYFLWGAPAMCTTSSCEE